MTDVGMGAGVNEANVERFRDLDSMYGSFTNLQFKTPNGWSDWAGPSVCEDNDESFDTFVNVGGDPTHVEMKLGDPNHFVFSGC
jgi:hypothetical protein